MTKSVRMGLCVYDGSLQDTLPNIYQETKGTSYNKKTKDKG